MIAVCIWRHSVESRGLKEKYSPKESSRQANDAGLLSLLLVELEGFAGGRTNKQRVGKRTEVAGYPTFINTFLTVHLLSRGKKGSKAPKSVSFSTLSSGALCHLRPGLSCCCCCWGEQGKSYIVAKSPSGNITL